MEMDFWILVVFHEGTVVLLYDVPVFLPRASAPK